MIVENKKKRQSKPYNYHETEIFLFTNPRLFFYLVQLLMDFSNKNINTSLIAETLCKGKQENNFVTQLITMFDTT